MTLELFYTHTQTPMCVHKENGLFLLFFPKINSNTYNWELVLLKVSSFAGMNKEVNLQFIPSNVNPATAFTIANQVVSLKL